MSRTRRRWSTSSPSSTWPGRSDRLPLIVIEQGALREGEAVSLTWGDVDAAGLRLRLRRSTTKRDKTRWISLPEWLMVAIEDVPARRSDSGAAGLPGDHRGVVVPGYDEGVSQREGSALQPARSPRSQDHDLAPLRCRRGRACPARGTREALDELRCLQRRNARGRGDHGATSRADRRLERRRGVVSVWSRRHAEAADRLHYTTVGFVRVVLHEGVSLLARVSRPEPRAGRLRSCR